MTEAQSADRQELVALGSALFDQVDDAIRAQDWMGLANMVHPKDVARCKEFVVAVVDAADEDELAAQLIHPFGADVPRAQVLASDGHEFLARCLAESYAPDPDTSEAVADAGSDTSCYHGTIVENSAAIHAIHQVSGFPSAMTFRWFMDRWWLTGMRQVAELESQSRELSSRLETGSSLAHLDSFLQSQLKSLRIIGKLSCDERLLAVLAELTTDLSKTYGVFAIRDDEPAWKMIQDDQRLATELRNRYQTTADAQKEQVRDFLKMAESLETLAEESAE